MSYSLPPAISPDLARIANPTWLTHALASAGLLYGAEVASVSARPDATTPYTLSKILHLDLEFSPENTCAAPRRLVLKTAKGKKEYIFFTRIVPACSGSPVLRCFYAEYDPQSDRACFLLEELAETHFQPEWPVPPALPLCEAVVECLARFHAGWRHNLVLKTELQPLLAEGNSWKSRIALAVERLPQFIAFLGDRLSPERKAIYQQVLRASVSEWQPDWSTKAATLLHGDAHFWNYLFPRDPARDTIRMIDWNGWDIGRGTDDLAYMIALHWFPERRRVYEIPLLRRYHTVLQESGIMDYSWDDCWRDYRLSVIMNLTIPVWQWYKGIPAGVWWPHLERSFLAFQDLNCAELL